ncbi:MAG: SecY-interacting protein Syd [Polyangiales bacterium]
MTKLPLHDAQERFFLRYLGAVRAATGTLPLSEDDAERPPPCFVGAVDERGLRPWRPLRRTRPAGDFSSLERCLGGALHPDLRAWFDRWCSLPVEGLCGEETVVLGFAASDAELAVLLDAASRSLAAHGEAREVSVPVAVFHDGRRVRAGNASGRVWIVDAEGQERMIARSLIEFIDAVEPLPL